MSDFLKRLYEEEMSKTGSAEFNSLMQALPRNELEDYLGLPKLASEEQPSDDEKRKLDSEKAKPEAKHQDVEPETNLDKKAAIQRVLGVMRKLAVAGPTEAPLPDSAPQGELEAKQKAIREAAQALKPQKESVPVDHQGPGKEAVEVARDGKKVTTTKEAMAWADSMGRKIAQVSEENDMSAAQEKAKIAMMSYRVTRDAPEQVKQASIQMAGRKIAEV